MSKGFGKYSHRYHGYWQRTLYPVHSLVIIAPLLVFFHAFTFYYGTNLLGPKVVGQLLRYFGATQALLPAMLIIVIMIVQQIGRRDPWAIQPTVMAGMVGESILWTIPLIGIGQLTGRLAQLVGSASAPPAPGSWLDVALRAVGAGVYEEFLFRMVMISLIVLLLTDVAGIKREISTTIGVITSAVIFSLCHFSWAQITPGNATPMPWHDFIFLCVAGVLWGGLYVYRGFAVAVGSHIVWDIYALTLMG